MLSHMLATRDREEKEGAKNTHRDSTVVRAHTVTLQSCEALRGSARLDRTSVPWLHSRTLASCRDT